MKEKDRLTFPQWEKSNKGINDKKDFDEAYLHAIFDRIAKKEIKVNDPDATSTPSSAAPPVKV